MGQLFVLCGPPGSGKTTLLKLVRQEGLSLENLQRITTRKPRIEEGDQKSTSLEYEFLDDPDFAGRLSRGTAVNFVEWNGGFYATDLETLLRSPASQKSYLLLEDIPSAVHLKHTLPDQATVFLLFTEDVDELLKIEFATLLQSRRPCVLEWKRRLKLKYASQPHHEQDENTYVQEKMRRAMFDLAFVAGKIRRSVDIRVLANRRDQQLDTLNAFKDIVESVGSQSLMTKSPGKFAFTLMPFRDQFNKIYRFVIKPTVEKLGLTCLRGDEVSTQLDVMADVLRHIDAAHIEISDITSGNPNVFLELGVSLNLSKPIILITQDEGAPFNVNALRRIRYDDTLDGWEKLRFQLSDAIQEIQQGDAERR